ncbi:MAG: hypothetical protein J6Z49_04855 [Kiritimatiellae bacterium]|nr:hypothetical protein [Kiritimatiellia bacterium]
MMPMIRNFFFAFFVLILPLLAEWDEASFANPPADVSRPVACLAVDGGRESDAHRAATLLDRAKNAGAGGVLVSLPAATASVWTNWSALATQAARYGFDIAFRDFSLPNSPAPGGKEVSSGIFARHVNQLLYQSQRNLRNVYGTSLVGYHFDRVPVGMCSIVNDLVQEAGLRASGAVFRLPLPPEEAAVYFHRPALETSTLHPVPYPFDEDSDLSEDILRKAAIRSMFNRRAAGGAHTFWREQIWGILRLSATPADVPGGVHLPFGWKPYADELLTAGATRVVLDYEGGLPSDDRRFRELREGCKYLQRCSHFLRQGDPVADFLFWPGALESGAWPEEHSFDTADRAMLAHALLERGRVTFASERSYEQIVVAPDVTNQAASVQLIAKCRRAGIAVSFWPSCPKPDVRWYADATGRVYPLRFCHRRERVQGRKPMAQAMDLYFLANPAPYGFDVNLTLRDAKHRPPILADPIKGEFSRPQDYTFLRDGSLQIRLPMDAYESRFILFGVP